MRIGVLGTGMVGGAIAGKLVELGHEVMMGSRERGNEKARAWAGAAGGGASEGSFTDAAAFGELVVNCTAGAHSLEALEQAGRANLAGKVLIDVAAASPRPAERRCTCPYGFASSARSEAATSTSRSSNSQAVARLAFEGAWRRRREPRSWPPTPTEPDGRRVASRGAEIGSISFTEAWSFPN